MSRGRDVQARPFLREAIFEWARAAAAGEADDLQWVDLNANPDTDAYRVRRNRRGRLLFRQLRYGRTLPPAMLQTIARAEMNGGATLLQALTLAFALPEWLVRSRSLLWTELSPAPAILAQLVEAYGISGEVHRGDAERLVRLRARLPAWHKRRGEVGEALRLLDEAIHARPSEDLSGATPPSTPRPGVTALLPGPVAAPEEAEGPPPPALDLEDAPVEELETAAVEEDPTDETPVVEPPPTPPAPPAHALADEVMSCRSLQWWARRAPADGSPADLRIDAGLLRFQPRQGQPFPLVREDVRVGWTIGQPLSPLAPRLLPPWACYRIVAAPPES